MNDKSTHEGQKIADDLALLTGQWWAFKPSVYTMHRLGSGQEVEFPINDTHGDFEWLKQEGAISGYQQGSRYPTSFGREVPVIVTAPHSRRIQELADQARPRVEEAEKAAHLLGLYLDCSTEVTRKEAVRGLGRMTLAHVPYDQLLKLRELESQGFINQKFRQFTSVRVVDYSEAPFKKSGMDMDRKEAARCLTVLTQGFYPINYPELSWPKNQTPSYLPKLKELAAMGIIRVDEKLGRVTYFDLPRLQDLAQKQLANRNANIIVLEMLRRREGGDLRKIYDNERGSFYPRDEQLPFFETLQKEGIIQFASPRNGILELTDFDAERLYAKAAEARVDVQSVLGRKEATENLSILMGANCPPLHCVFPVFHHTAEKIYVEKHNPRVSLAYLGLDTLLKSLSDRRIIDYEGSASTGITINVLNPTELERLATEVVGDLEKQEDVKQLVRTTIGNEDLYFPERRKQEPLEFSSYGNPISVDDLKKLDDLVTKGVLHYVPATAAVDVSPVDRQGLIAYLEPRLSEEIAEFQRAARSNELAYLIGGQFPWGERNEKRGGIFRLEGEGIISVTRDGHGWPRITVLDEAKLAPQIASAQEKYKEEKEAACLLTQMTGYPFRPRHGAISTEFADNEPAYPLINKVRKGLWEEGAITKGAFIYPDSRQYSDKNSLTIWKFDLDKLRQYAAKLAPG